jgi:hypothetical protein
MYDISTVPEETPVTIPVLLPTVACAGMPLLQVPPEEGSLITMVWPTHTAPGPAISAGDATTVTVIDAGHPAGVKHVNVTTPGEIPETMPVDDPMTAIAGRELLQVTPGDEVRTIVEPLHTEFGPLTGKGSGLTVTVAVAAQPVEGKVYDTVSIPALKPVTTPPAEIWATPVEDMPQVPPGVASANVVVSPMHTRGVPVIAAGSGFTVSVFVTVQPLPSE